MLSKRERPAVAFHVIGGLGDHLLSARFIRDFATTAGPIKFDIYTKRPALAEWVFQDVPGIANILHVSSDIKWLRRQYVLFMDAIGYLAVRHADPKRLTKPGHERLQRLHQSTLEHVPKLRKFTRLHPDLDGYLGHYVATKGFKRHNFLHHMAGIDYPGDTLSLPTDEDALQTFGLAGKPYITVSNGYDDATEVPPGQVVTKVYPFHAEVVSRLKRDYPGLTVVQIGAGNSTPIDTADFSLVGKTTLSQAAALIQHAQFHLDNEGGLVHLARALGTRCCVVFGPTLPSYFGYEANLNIAPRECGACWWMEGRWMTHCVKGSALPPCMYTQSPLDVVAQIEQTFAAQLHALRGSGARTSATIPISIQSPLPAPPQASPAMARTSHKL